MSTKKNGTLAPPLEWAKHQRPEIRRRQWKAERQAAKALIRRIKEEAHLD